MARKTSRATKFQQLGAPNEGEIWNAKPARAVDYPTTHRCPNRHPLGPNQVLVGARRLPRPRRWTHQLALPHLRRRGVRATAEYALHDARRAGDCADLDEQPELRAVRTPVGPSAGAQAEWGIA
jgi:hypothetical protein